MMTLKIPMKKLKGALRSRTMLFAFIAQDCVGVLLISNDFVQSQLSAQAFGWYLIVIGMAQKILRWVTTNSLDKKY